MAETSIDVDAPPARVWEVLSDARGYGDWVVGSKEIRFWDPDFPAQGSAFHHTFLIGPLPLKDRTTVLAVEPERRLLLRARARPTGVAHVHLELEPVDGRTRVTIGEVPVEGLPARLHNPVQDWLIKRRNDLSLKRLKELAEGQRPIKQRP